MSSDPALGATNLIERLLHRSPEPPVPVDVKIARIGKITRFDRENDDVVLEDDEQVADLLAGPLLSLRPLSLRTSG